MIQITDQAVRSYIAYSAILGLKLLFVTLLTISARFRKSVFANPEDLTSSKAKVKYDDPDVERARRAHLNDLENIPAFWVLGALYLTTEPSAAWATLLFRTFTVCRALHTVVYVITPLPQPARAAVFFIAYLVNWYMGIQVVLHYASAL